MSERKRTEWEDRARGNFCLIDFIVAPPKLCSPPTPFPPDTHTLPLLFPWQREQMEKVERRIVGRREAQTNSPYPPGPSSSFFLSDFSLSLFGMEKGERWRAGKIGHPAEKRRRRACFRSLKRMVGGCVGCLGLSLLGRDPLLPLFYTFFRAYSGHGRTRRGRGGLEREAWWVEERPLWDGGGGSSARKGMWCQEDRRRCFPALPPPHDQKIRTEFPSATTVVCALYVHTV